MILYKNKTPLSPLYHIHSAANPDEKIESLLLLKNNGHNPHFLFPFMFLSYNMKKGDELVLEIVSLNSEGAGIAKTPEGLVIFIKNALPGDSVNAKIIRKKNKFAEGEILNIIKKSPHRVEPFCPDFGVCGGCKIQNYLYEKQLDFKTAVARDAFRKIGGFDNIDFPLAIGCNEIYFYRNKMEFSFSDDKWFTVKENKSNVNFALGLHIPKFYSKILDVEYCKLQSEISSGILNFSREFFKSRNVSVYNTRNHTGLLRFLVIRQSKNTNDLMINLITNEFDKSLAEEFTNELLDNFPSVTTVINSVSEKKAQVAFSEKEFILYGKGFIYEILNNNEVQYKFKISPNSFFQTNTAQTEVLYKTGLEFLNLSQNDSVLDLYCGAGTISLYVSHLVKNVTGVEIVKDAIDNANENASLNNVANTEFIRSDIRDYIKQIDLNNRNFNILILDPPRSGLHPDICKILSGSDFEKILYISCNPGTQARDLQIICSENKYRIAGVQPVDMFPQTYHIENICLLTKNSG